jgi:hypothetical protein
MQGATALSAFGEQRSALDRMLLKNSTPDCIVSSRLPKWISMRQMAPGIASNLQLRQAIAASIITSERAKE